MLIIRPQIQVVYSKTLRSVNYGNSPKEHNEVIYIIQKIHFQMLFMTLKIFFIIQIHIITFYSQMEPKLE